METQTTTPESEIGDERRIAGIDRWTIGPALLVLALAVLMSVVLPWVNSETDYSDAVDEGDVVQLADGITLVPAPGWNLASGALAGQTRSEVGSTESTELVRGNVRFAVQVAPFDGTASALLTQIDEINAEVRRAQGRTAQTTGRYTVTTRQGVAGVAEDFVSVARRGSIVAFVFASGAQSASSDGQPTDEGVEIVASGPSGAMSRRRDDIVSMIRSIRAAS
jgi:ferric-dicitrate binding protein FerR (iron transport regulator)